MSETRQFPLRDVLSVTTGRLLTKPKGDNDNGIGAIYELLNWMTSDDLFTHQMPSAARECEPWLMRWFPNLKLASDALPELDAMMKLQGNGEGVETWLTTIIAGGQPRVLDVPKIPRDDHDVKDPLEELKEMRGGDHGIIVVNL